MVTKRPNYLDLLVTNTVFSSILDAANRQAMAEDMWRVLRLGGWVMVFDFRHNNPSNRDVKKVTRKELRRYWPSAVNEKYQTLILAPPLARRLIPISYLAGNILSSLASFLRSHFIFMVQKAF